MKLTLNLIFAFFLVGLCPLASSSDMEGDAVEKAKLFSLRMDRQSGQLFDFSEPFGKDTEYYRLIVQCVGEKKPAGFFSLGF